MHLAETILQYMENLLTGLPTTGINIRRNDVYPFQNGVTAALTLLMGSDEMTGDSYLNIGTVDRTLTVNVYAHVRGTGNLDTMLNQVRSEVYSALATDPTLGNNCGQCVLVEDQAPRHSLDEQPTAVQVMVWRVEYRHSILSSESI